MFFRLSIALFNLTAVIFAVYTELWHFLLMAPLVSMFFIRARMGFKQEDSIYWFKPDVMALLVIMIYVVPTVLDALLGRNVLMLEQNTLLKYSVLIFLFTSTMFITTISLNRNIQLPNEKHIYQGQSHYALFAYILIALGGFMYLYMVLNQFGSIGNLIALQRLEYYREVQGLGFFLAGISFLRFGWIFLFILHLTSPSYRGKILIHYFFLAIFCTYFLAQGERGIWVKLMVGIIFVHLFFHHIRLRYVIIAMVISIVGLQAFSRFRFALDAPNITAQEMLSRANIEWLNLAGGEAGSHFALSQDVLNDPELSRMRYGRTYVDSFLNLIPRIIWPNRDQYVVLPQVEYMLKYYDRTFFQGGGRAYSFFLEAYINFWYLGPLLMGSLVGWTMSWFYRKTVLQRPDALKLALFASSFGSLLLLVRSPFSAILKDFMLSSLLPFMFIQAMIFIDGFTRRN